VGLSVAKNYVAINKKVNIDMIVVDINGESQSGYSIRLACYLEDEKQWYSISTSVTSRNQPVPYKISFPRSGKWRVYGIVEDVEHRLTESSIAITVMGPHLIGSQFSENITNSQILIKSDKKKYAPGESAIITVECPFWPAQGMCIIRSLDIEGISHFDLQKKGKKKLYIHILEKFMPSVTIEIIILGSESYDISTHDSKRHITYASETLSLDISLESVQLKLEILPDSLFYSPGGMCEVQLRMLCNEVLPVDGEIVFFCGRRFCSCSQWLHTPRSS
jgi:uncharacterized protein YfaS (alpha-2-macroglobulin family)